MTLTTRYTIPSSTMLQIVDDEVLLFNSSNELFFTINEVGAAMWEVMQDYSKLQDVVDELKEYFDVSIEQLSTDVLVFSQSLSDQGLMSFEA